MKQADKHISIDSNIRFGKPGIIGTRIAVIDTLQWLASGMSLRRNSSGLPLPKASAYSGGFSDELLEIFYVGCFL